MASVCVDNIPTSSYSTYSWLTPKIPNSNLNSNSNSNSSSSDNKLKSDLDSTIFDTGDFEFRLGDNLTMLPADELFSDGKLVLLQYSTLKKSPPSVILPEEEVKSPELENSSQNTSNEDPYLFSPKAPRCSSRWREFLGLKKLQGQSKTTSSSSSTNSKLSIRYFLNRNSKTSADTSSLTLPLLKDSSFSSSSSTECEPVSTTLSRISLSSTSSDHDHDELPRPSLTGEKSNIQPTRSSPKLQCVRPREDPWVGRSSVRNDMMTARRRNISVDSPRMNSSGRVVFQSLERSSSGPSSFNGGPRRHINNNNSYKNRGSIMERSYSGNVHVRITPVLNVPVVCSIRGSSKAGVFGFSHLFSSSSTSQVQKKEGNNNNNNNGVNHINSRSIHQKKEGSNNNNGNNNIIFRNKKLKEKENS